MYSTWTCLDDTTRSDEATISITQHRAVARQPVVLHSTVRIIHLSKRPNRMSDGEGPADSKSTDGSNGTESSLADGRRRSGALAH